MVEVAMVVVKKRWSRSKLIGWRFSEEGEEVDFVIWKKGRKIYLGEKRIIILLWI